MLDKFLQPGKASVMMGGQFGSEAKGLVASYIASKFNRDLVDYMLPTFCTTNAGAQAGHTTILPDGAKFVCYHLPTMGVLHRDAYIYLNAGSIIDTELLRHELMAVAGALKISLQSLVDRLVIHPNAALITKDAKEEEAGGATTHIGSTQKGVGAALSHKIMRRPQATMGGQFGDHWPMISNPLMAVKIGALDLNYEMTRGAIVTIEIPQGTDLSINASAFYPKCTSRDCWLTQGLADAGIHPSFLGMSVMVNRTFPIRVGHIYDMIGGIAGDSGPFYPTSKELEWTKDFPGIEPERTTVTKRVRRIASWSEDQYIHGLRLNRPDAVVITFVNYFKTSVDFAQFARRLEMVHHRERIKPVMYFSWGPRSDQVGDYKEAAEWLMERDYPTRSEEVEQVSNVELGAGGAETLPDPA